LNNLVGRAIVFDRHPVIRKALANLRKGALKILIARILG